jgi:hypothetical protein
LLARADNALYAAKAQGRNRIAGAGPIISVFGDREPPPI